MSPIMPRYVFALDNPPFPGVAEKFPDDVAAKRHACTIADEINRNTKVQSRVLVLDHDGELLAAASPVDE
jgi:hypothetical protein